MIIFPAIDIMDGKPVRLLRGDFDTAEQVAEDVLTTAKQFARVCSTTCKIGSVFTGFFCRWWSTPR